MQPEQMSVPVEAVAQAIAEQRNAALDQAAQWQAAALQLKAERDQALADQAAQWQAAALQLKAERDQALADLEKLRADA